MRTLLIAVLLLAGCVDTPTFPEPIPVITFPVADDARAEPVDAVPDSQDVRTGGVRQDDTPYSGLTRLRLRQLVPESTSPPRAVRLCTNTGCETFELGGFGEVSTLSMLGEAGSLTYLDGEGRTISRSYGPWAGVRQLIVSGPDGLPIEVAEPALSGEWLLHAAPKTGPVLVPQLWGDDIEAAPGDQVAPEYLLRIESDALTVRDLDGEVVAELQPRKGRSFWSGGCVGPPPTHSQYVLVDGGESPVLVRLFENSTFYHGPVEVGGSCDTQACDIAGACIVDDSSTWCAPIADDGCPEGTQAAYGGSEEFGVDVCVPVETIAGGFATSPGRGTAAVRGERDGTDVLLTHSQMTFSARYGGEEVPYALELSNASRTVTLTVRAPDNGRFIGDPLPVHGGRVRANFADDWAREWTGEVEIATTSGGDYVGSLTLQSTVPFRLARPPWGSE